MLDALSSSAGLLVLLGGAVAVLAAWFKWLRPKLHKAKNNLTAAGDAILGRDAKYDTITGELVQPSLPGLGVRMAIQEQKVDTLSNAVVKIAESQGRLDNHEERIKQLEVAAIERVVSRAESTQAWAAMEAAHNAQPPLPFEND